MKIFYAFMLLYVWIFQFVDADEQYTIAIIGSNDVHGKAFPTTLIRQDTGLEYMYGGLTYMATLVDIIR